MRQTEYESGGSVGETAGDVTNDILRRLDQIDYTYIVFVIAAALLLIWSLRRVIPWMAEFLPAKARLAVLGILPIARLVILVLAIVLIFPKIFVLSRENIIVISGALGVAIGFAFKDLVASMIAGIVAIFEKPYRPGDWVKIGTEYGEVTDVGLRSFRMVTPSDDTVTVTHDRIWSESIVNGNDGAETLMCVTDFYVAPDHDAKMLRAVLRDVATTSPYLSYQKPVQVILSETPWSTYYRVKAYPFDMRDQFRFISDITVRGKEALRMVGAKEVTAPAALDPKDPG